MIARMSKTGIAALVAVAALTAPAGAGLLDDIK